MFPVVRDPHGLFGSIGRVDVPNRVAFVFQYYVIAIYFAILIHANKTETAKDQ